MYRVPQWFIDKQSEFKLQVIKVLSCPVLWAKGKIWNYDYLTKLKLFGRCMILYALIIVFLYLMVVGFTVQRYFLMGRLCWLLGYFFFIFILFKKMQFSSKWLRYWFSSLNGCHLGKRNGHWKFKMFAAGFCSNFGFLHGRKKGQLESFSWVIFKFCKSAK